MNKRTWTIEDDDEGLYLEQLDLQPGHVGGPAAGYRVVKRTLQTGLSKGVDVIEVDNGVFQFVVIPTRGMGLWRASLGEVQLAWRSPVRGPVHPALVNLADEGGLGWLRGFDELLCRCGLESNGAPERNPDGTLRYGLHGRIANTPANKVQVAIDRDSGEITVVGVVDETRLFGNKLRLATTITTRVGQPGLSIADTITNLSAEPGELELLYHFNLGVPLLGPGAKVLLPVKKMAPRDAAAAADLPDWTLYKPPAPGLPEAAHYFQLAADAQGQTQAVLCGAAGDRGVSLKFNTGELPCFTLWKNRQAPADGYVTGLEPGINFPNAKSFERHSGRVAVVSPGESRTYHVAIEVHGDAAGVEAAAAAVKTLQGAATPEFRSEPDPAWSPAGTP
jgi:hypothetical protein